MRLIRTGKVKEVYEVDKDTLEFVFTDNISVFDKIIPSSIPYKGETLCRTAVFWFQLLKTKGFRSHFKEFIPPNRMRVRRFQIIEDYDLIDTSSVNYLIPLEVISRHYAAGSLLDRLKDGSLKAEDLGFPAGHVVTPGEKLPLPYVEASTKLEEVDRLLDEKEAKSIAGLSDEEFQQIRDTTLAIDEVIADEAAERLLIHVDGKKEYGYDDSRQLMIIDTFGTLDEDRWWDADDYISGEAQELSKELIRRHYRDSGYFDLLMEARRNGEPEPDIPALPDELVGQVSQLYVDMFERITGESFR